MKRWLKEYPPDVLPGLMSTVRVVPTCLKSIERYRNLVAYECMGVEFTYDDLDRNSQDFASYRKTSLA